MDYELRTTRLAKLPPPVNSLTLRLEMLRSAIRTTLLYIPSTGVFGYDMCCLSYHFDYLVKFGALIDVRQNEGEEYLPLVAAYALTRNAQHS